MEPKTLSATSLSVAELCLARWEAEMLDKAARRSHPAALRGTAVHGALEMYVKAVYIDKTMSRDFDLLRTFYMVSFEQTFGHTDTRSEDFLDGVGMLKTWYERDSYLNDQSCEVLEVENKKRFPLKTSIGEIPFTYIFDRLDKIGPNDYRVVDYKSSAWPVTSEELLRKIQPRVYALAVRLEYPDAERVWVEFDMLRHQRVGVTFSKDDCRETWKYLKRAAERIIATPEGQGEETLNEECRFCIRVATCGSVASNVSAGGITTMPIEDAIERYGVLQAKKAAIAAACGQLESLIENDAKEYGWFEKVTTNATAKWGSQRRRTVDGDMVAKVVPPEIMARYGKTSITLKEFDVLVTDPNLTDEQRRELRGLVGSRTTTPSLKVSLKKASEDND